MLIISPMFEKLIGCSHITALLQSSEFAERGICFSPLSIVQPLVIVLGWDICHLWQIFLFKWHRRGRCIVQSAGNRIEEVGNVVCFNSNSKPCLHLRSKTTRQGMYKRELDKKLNEYIMYELNVKSIKLLNIQFNNPKNSETW